MPEISVIVPVYKAENYLRGCIDSILSQSVSDIELIAVDDGSPDGCGDICEEYAARDCRVRVIHQTNQGQAAARNHAIAEAKGKWLCFVDSDDEIHPQMLERLLCAAQSARAPMSMCRMLEAPALPPDFLKPAGKDWQTVPMEDGVLADLVARGAYPGWVACGKLIRRELVESYLFCPGRVYEDNEAVCRWIYGAKILASVPEALYFYRTNPDSTTQRRFTQKNLDYLWALESIIRFYSGNGYVRLRERFCGAYAETAADFYYRAKHELKDNAAARGIEKGARRMRKEVPFTKEQFEIMLNAMHPNLARFYWPAEGVTRTLREKGLSGLARKLGEKLRREAKK